MATSSSITWLIDLDNTLHDATPHIFPQIHRDMTAYVARSLQLPHAAADQLRLDYWQRYGATLVGMMRHHDTDPHDFLWQTHQFPALADMLVFEQQLARSLQQLPGRKILFTNSPQHYAEAILEAIGIRPLFDALYAIEALQFHPKPDVASFLHLLQQEALPAAHCVMIEDSAANLHTAKTLGMQTVLINTDQQRDLATPDWVDLRIESLQELPHHLDQLRRDDPGASD
ncbi:MAG: pyrimidine 5'-nucleotidase [Sterolibacterium sp.]|nr:pyrimidine 5'-nucleotidase [Sterolibacterium sp.]